MLLATFIAAAFPAYAADETSEAAEASSQVYQSTLPTITVVGQPETSVLKGYINYDEASVTRNGQLIKETPQTIDTLNILTRSTSKKTKTTAPTTSAPFWKAMRAWWQLGRFEILQRF